MSSVPITRRAKELIVRASSSFLAPLYGGIGSIVMLHRIADDMPAERVGWCKDLEVTSTALEGIVALFRKRGYAFLSLDEVRDVLKKKTKSRAKFVAFTFDDGYRDVFTHGFPILTSAGAPFTLYVTTGYPDKTLVHWWYLLEELVLRAPRVTFEHRERRYDFPLQNHAERELAFDQIGELFHAGKRESNDRLAALLFGAERTKESVDALSIGWEELRTMAEHPLATIGAHTLSHPNLRTLSRDDARHEMSESKRVIEARLGREVRHFAYPLGALQHAAEREFELAKECGFETATTTRLANIFPANRDHMQSLPRLYAAEPRDMEIQISGAVSAFRFRGRRAITA